MRPIWPWHGRKIPYEEDELGATDGSKIAPYGHSLSLICLLKTFFALTGAKLRINSQDPAESSQVDLGSDTTSPSPDRIFFWDDAFHTSGEIIQFCFFNKKLRQ